MISMLLSLHPIFIKNKAFEFFMIFLFAQIFYVLQSIAYIENLGLHHYVGFSQILSYCVVFKFQMKCFNVIILQLCVI